MKRDATLFPRARIPYGTWGSSYFPAWQTSAFAEVNIGQFEPLSEAIAVQARHAGGFMAAAECRAGSIGAAFHKTMAV